MNKIELLAPVGNMECLEAAIEAGCDAVYLAGKSFGARAFSKNFTEEELVDAIKYAHLYGVKVYVTVNTLIYDNEVDSFLEYVRFLHKNNVDALIIQDLGMIDLVRKTFPNLELHASTQAHIHNLDGVEVMDDLGIKRVVLARETSIDTIREIKKKSNMEIEIFIHGALCISYSGQCLMSSLIGGRSGNRGTCAGSCRLRYDVVDEFDNKLNTYDYPLSTKDLNSLEGVSELIDAGVNSLKIEGRMKSREYVYMVVRLYREAIDSYYETGEVKIREDELLKLKKIFNREYTIGFLFNTENNDLINGYRPNHMGVKVGEVTEYNKGTAKIKLCDKVSIGSGLRVLGKSDVGILVNDFYIDGVLVKEADKGDIISIRVNKEVKVGSDVVITLDKALSTEIVDTIKNKLRRVLITGRLVAHIGDSLSLTISDGVNTVTEIGDKVDRAKNNPTSEEDVRTKLMKLGDTVYQFSELEIIKDSDIFIPLSLINQLRQKAVLALNKKRMYEIEFREEEYHTLVPDFPREELLSVFLADDGMINKLDRGYDVIYTWSGINNTIKKMPRVINEYPDTNNIVMVGEIGAFNKYKEVITDFSLNVTNSYTVALLHSLGAKRVTLSYELNDIQIDNLIKSYISRYGKRPNLELIVDGHEEVMVSKFSLNKYYDNDKIYLRDMFGNKYKVITRDNIMYIYNYKKRNIFDNKYYNMGVNCLRINLD